MGEAVLFDARVGADGQVQLGPLRFAPRQALASGPVQVAVRPEAWLVGPAGAPGLAATLAKMAYLGAVQELSFDTALGPVFVVSPDLARRWQPGDGASLTLASRGVSVLQR
jgi:iron(III) transport system ATP-binding protein